MPDSCGHPQFLASPRSCTSLVVRRGAESMPFPREALVDRPHDAGQPAVPRWHGWPGVQRTEARPGSFGLGKGWAGWIDYSSRR